MDAHVVRAEELLSYVTGRESTSVQLWQGTGKANKWFLGIL